MCGLFGAYSFEGLSDDLLNRLRVARDTLTHRGPDQAGEFVTPHLYLGHRRLSIMDISESGRQPMLTADQSIAITVNGEIYNFQSLRQELIDLGYVFHSHSDSEVVLHGYAAWGIEALARRIDGMYAIVIFDRQNGQIHFVRDRVGIKPLLYYRDASGIVWSSELRAIENYCGSGLELDPEALIDFLVYRYIPAPKTAYRSVYKLKPATILTLDLETEALNETTYWTLPVSNSSPLSLDDAQNQVRALIRESVTEQLVSDVPLGVFLSGGIDSSAITAFAAAAHPHIQSFSIGFHDAGRDETPYATLVSNHFKTRHTNFYHDDHKMDHIADDMIGWFDEPFGDTSAVPTLMVSKLARENVTVALSGDGGDELFGGYKWYEAYAKALSQRRWNIAFRSPYGYELPDFIPRRKGLELLTISDDVILYARMRGCPSMRVLDRWKERLGVARDYDPFWAYRAVYDSSLPPRKAAQVMDFHTYLPDDIMVKVDRMSMLASLECRPPFLSQKIIEFVFGLPDSFIYSGDTLKGLLKSSLKDVLPQSILHRPKQGFSVPPQSGWRARLIADHGSVSEALLSAFLNKRRT